METIAQKTYLLNPDKLFKILLEALGKNFDIKRIEDPIRTVEVSTGMSLLSFGENFEIIVASYDNGSIVRVKAKSKIRWNVTSDVKNKANEIFKLLDSHL
jgi:hypothetical protein